MLSAVPLVVRRIPEHSHCHRPEHVLGVRLARAENGRRGTDELDRSNPSDTGLGRIVRPVQVSAEAAERTPTHLQIIEGMLKDPSLRHVAFDISWDEVAKYAVSSPEVSARVASLLNQYSDRFLFGTDTVAPSSPQPYYAVFDLWAPVWKALTPEASRRVRMGNYERIFDEGRREVRAWEKANVP